MQKSRSHLGGLPYSSRMGRVKSNVSRIKSNPGGGLPSYFSHGTKPKVAGVMRDAEVTERKTA